MVTQTLQMHFDKQLSFWDIDEKFAKIMRFIAPEHLDHFREFRNQVLWVISQNPGSEEIVSKNLDKWIEEFNIIEKKHTNRNQKAVIITAEWLGIDDLKEYNKNRKR